MPLSRILNTTTSRRRVIAVGVLTVMIAGLLFAGVSLLSRAKARAQRLAAYGRLSQMRVALHLYENGWEKEDGYGTLPPLCLRDEQGKPSLSWRVLMLPYLGSFNKISSISTQLNLSEPWNSDHNRGGFESVPSGDWVWFALDREHITSPVSTQILAYIGRESIWDERTGLPKGTMEEYPDAILLIWIPRSDIHPMQPGDITDGEIRERIQNGEEVLFIAAGGGSKYGIVTMERGELTFRTWQQLLDRREGRQ
jgi:hypothetical protein